MDYSDCGRFPQTDPATSILDVYLKTEAAGPLKTLVTTYETAKCHNLEEHN
jgi:hypothetical protein